MVWTRRLGPSTTSTQHFPNNDSSLPPSQDFFGKSDPYLEFAKENRDGSFSSVHRTEVIKNTLEPYWNPFKISSQTLCSSDPARRIKVGEEKGRVCSKTKASTMRTEVVGWQDLSSIICLGTIFQVVCYDWDSDGSHDLIGQFQTSLAELTEVYQSGKEKTWEVINPEKQHKKKYKNSGTAHLKSIKVSSLGNKNWGL